MTEKTRVLFVMDPFKTVQIDRDTTYAFMREAQRRGFEVLACRVGDLGTEGKRGYAHAKWVRTTDIQARPIEIDARAQIPFDDLDFIFMRKDPPFNIEYVFATYLLDCVDPSRTKVVNRPSGLREANEKAFILRFDEVTPRTIVTMGADDVYVFLREEGGRCIIKPLDGAGGSGVYMLRKDDPNLTSLVETATDFGQRYVMCQTYLPAAKQGDKRVILINGEPAGATLRVPKPGELRGNIHVGATCEKTELTASDRRICDAIAPSLRELGLYFVGIDVIGGLLTEVNVTSPTGVQEVNEFDGTSLEAQLWDFLVN